MMKKILVFCIFIISVLNISAQTDTSENFIYPIPDSNYQSNYNDYQSNTNFDELFMYKTQLQTQKLIKNLFLGGFIFMTLVVIFLFYINQTKIREVLKLIKIQEREIFIKKFEVEKLSAILNNTMDGIVIIDTDNKILWNNSSFLNLYNYKNDELQNKKLNFFVNDNEEIQKLISKCKNEKTPVQFTFESDYKNNSKIYIQRRILPIIDQNSNDVNYVVIDTDFTALKLATKK